MKNEFAAIPDAIRRIRAGEIIIVVDDPDRENEGDFVMAAEKVTPAAINFMAKFGRGLICVPMMGDRLDRLGLTPMVNVNSELREAAFTVSVDVKKGTSTGISAADRAKTIKALLDNHTRAEDLAKPGHVFPLRAREGGVLVRTGHTEAGVDLSRLAGLAPAAVICEIMSPDGSMARMSELKRIAKRHKIAIITIRDLIGYRRTHEKLVKRLVTTRLPTRFGEFNLHLYEDTVLGEHHVALVKGDVSNKRDVPVRVHSSCFTGDVLESLRCDCGEQLRSAMILISQAPRGVVLYMHQEGRGIGLMNKLHAYVLQDGGLDTVEANLKLGFPADLRDYGIGAQILTDLGLSTIQLITNNPRKLVGLDGYGLKITKRIPLVIDANPINARYLATKKRKLGHLLGK